MLPASPEKKMSLDSTMRDLLTKGIVAPAQQRPTILTFVDVDVWNFYLPVKKKCMYLQASI